MPSETVLKKGSYLRCTQSCLFEGLPEALYPLVYKLLQPIHFVSLHVGVENLSPQLAETSLNNVNSP